MRRYFLHFIIILISTIFYAIGGNSLSQEQEPHKEKQPSKLEVEAEKLKKYMEALNKVKQIRQEKYPNVASEKVKDQLNLLVKRKLKQGYSTAQTWIPMKPNGKTGKLGTTRITRITPISVIPTNIRSFQRARTGIMRLPFVGSRIADFSQGRMLSRQPVGISSTAGVIKSLPKEDKTNSKETKDIIKLHKAREDAVYKLEKGLMELKVLMLKLENARLCNFGCSVLEKRFCAPFGSYYSCSEAKGICMKVCSLLTDFTIELDKLRESKAYELDMAVLNKKINALLGEVSKVISESNQVLTQIDLGLEKKARKLCNLIYAVATGNEYGVTWRTSSFLQNLSLAARKILHTKLVAEFSQINKKLLKPIECEGLKKDFVMSFDTQHNNQPQHQALKDVRYIINFLDAEERRIFELKGISSLNAYYSIVFEGSSPGVFSWSNKDLVDLLPFIQKEKILEALNWNKCTSALREKVLKNSLSVEKLGIEVDASIENISDNSVLLFADKETLEKLKENLKKLYNLRTELPKLMSEKSISNVSKLLERHLKDLLKYTQEAEQILNSIINKKLALYETVLNEINKMIIKSENSCDEPEACKSCLLYIANLLRNYLALLTEEKELMNKELSFFKGKKEDLQAYLELPKPHLKSFLARLKHDLGLLYYITVMQFIKRNFNEPFSYLSKDKLKDTKDGIKFFLQASRAAGSLITLLQYFFNITACIEVKKENGKVEKFKDIYEFLQYISERVDYDNWPIFDIKVPGFYRYENISQYFLKFILPDINFEHLTDVMTINRNTGKVEGSGDFLTNLLCMNCLWYNGNGSKCSENTYLALFKITCPAVFTSTVFDSLNLKFIDKQYSSLPVYVKKIVEYVRQNIKNGESPERYGLKSGELSGNLNDVIWNIILDSDIDELPNQEFMKEIYKYSTTYQYILKNRNSFTFDEELLKGIKEELKKQFKSLSDLSPENFANRQAFEEAVSKAGGWNPNYLFSSPKRDEICKAYEKILLK